MCAECDTVWMSPENISVCSAIFPTPPRFCIPQVKCCLIDSRWATWKEIEMQGWTKFIAPETVIIE